MRSLKVAAVTQWQHVGDVFSGELVQSFKNGSFEYVLAEYARTRVRAHGSEATQKVRLCSRRSFDRAFKEHAKGPNL